MITDQQALAMREQFAEGITVAELARAFGQDPRNVRRVLRGETFAHLPGATQVDSSRLHPKTVQRIIADLRKPDWRGRDAEIRRKYGITYNTLKRLKSLAT